MPKEFIKDIKLRIIDYLHHLCIYDYIAIFFIVVFFLFSIIFTFLLAKKRASLALFWLFLSFFITISSPIFIKIYFDKTIRKIKIFDIKEHKLKFAKMLVIKGKIQNKGKIEFKKCRIFVKIYKKEQNKYKKYLNILKPYKYKSILINSKLKIKEIKKFKIVLENFDPKFEFETKIDGECY